MENENNRNLTQNGIPDQTELQTSYQTPENPPKKHTALIVTLVIAGILIIGAAVAWVMAKDIIINRFMLATKSSVEYFQWVSRKGTKKLCDSLDMAETADRLKAIQEELAAYKDGVQADVRISADLSEEFTDLLNIYPMKPMALSLSAAGKDKEASLSIKPSYGGKELFKANAFADAGNNVLKAEIPDYKEGIIDLSFLYDSEISEGKTIKDILSEAQQAHDKAKESEKRFDMEEIKADITAYSDCFINAVTDVELLKKDYVSLGEESVKCSKVIVKLNNPEFRNWLKASATLFYEEHSDEIGAALDQMGTESVSKEDIEKLIDSMSSDIAGKLVLYADEKGDIIALDVRGDYQTTTAGLDIRWQKTGTGKRHITAGVMLNDLKVLNIELDVAVNLEDSEFKAVLTPESLVEAFLQSASGMRLECTGGSSLHKKHMEMSLFKGSSVIAKTEYESNVREFTGHLLREEGKPVYDAEKWQEEEYFNLNDLAGFLFGIYDRIDEDVLGDVINDYLHEYFGDDVDLDMIRNWYDNGIFGWFSSTEELKEALSDDPLMLNEYGYPTGIREYTYEYPDVGKDYYYSYAELADYCTLAAYRGREFVWPEPVEATPEQLAVAKEDFLKLYRNKYKVDQHEAEVEWGDEVYIDILPYLYGFPVKAYFFENSYAKIGDEMYGPGLDEKLLGMKVGEVRDVTATLTGEQYGDFEGMEVDFEITLITIDRNVEPSWTEEFVCGRLGYESLAACEDMLKKELTVEAEVTDEEILEKISREAKAMTEYDELPRLMQLKLWNRRYNIAYRDTMNFFGMTPEAQYVATFNDLKTTSDPTVRGYYKMMDQGLERSIQEHSFYAAVAENENLKVTGAELAQAVDAKMAELHIATFDELMKTISLEEITDAVIEQKADAIMLETAVIKR